jgi:hypothetical protein
MAQVLCDKCRTPLNYIKCTCCKGDCRESCIECNGHGFLEAYKIPGRHSDEWADCPYCQNGTVPCGCCYGKGYTIEDCTTCKVNAWTAGVDAARIAEEKRIKELYDNAQKNVDAWQKAITLVRQAEHQAGYKIDLPAKLLDRIPDALTFANSSDVETRVKWSERAITNQKEIIRFAVNKIEEDLKIAQGAEYKAHDRIKQVIGNSDRTIADMASQRDSAVNSRKKEVERTDPDLPRNVLLGGCGAGFVLGILISVGLGMNANEGFGTVWYSCIGGAILFFLIYQWDVRRSDLATSQSIAQIESATNQKCAEAEAMLQKSLPNLNNQLANARAYSNKLQAAIKILKS